MDASRPFSIEAHAVFRADKMGKATLFESKRVLLGLNCFEAGQAHALHAHGGQDKTYIVVSGRGVYLREGSREPLGPGQAVVAPSGVPHGIENPGPERLLVLAIMAPSPA